MKKVIFIFILVFILIALSSCFMTFKYSIKKQFNEANIDLGKVQFFNKNQIVLKRILKNDEITAASGKVNFSNGKYYEEIIIWDQTPCVVDKVDDEKNIIYVKFENGENKSIPFILKDDVYKIFFDPVIVEKYIGKLSYQTKDYFLEKGRDSYLVINYTDRVIEKVDSKILKGIKLDQK